MSVTTPESAKPKRTRATSKTVTLNNGPARAVLPTEHIKHDAVFVNELRARHFAFKTGREALQAELDGRRLRLDEDIAALRRDFESAERQLLGQISDMQAGEDRAVRALGEDGLGDQNAKQDAE